MIGLCLHCSIKQLICALAATPACLRPMHHLKLTEQAAHLTVLHVCRQRRACSAHNSAPQCAADQSSLHYSVDRPMILSPFAALDCHFSCQDEANDAASPHSGVPLLSLDHCSPPRSAADEPDRGTARKADPIDPNIMSPFATQDHLAANGASTAADEPDRGTTREINSIKPNIVSPFATQDYLAANRVVLSSHGAAEGAASGATRDRCREASPGANDPSDGSEPQSCPKEHTTRASSAAASDSQAPGRGVGSRCGATPQSSCSPPGSHSVEQQRKASGSGRTQSPTTSANAPPAPATPEPAQAGKVHERGDGGSKAASTCPPPSQKSKDLSEMEGRVLSQVGIYQPCTWKYTSHAVYRNSAARLFLGLLHRQDIAHPLAPRQAPCPLQLGVVAGHGVAMVSL